MSRNLDQYRLDYSAGGFEFTAVQNNVFDTPVGDGKQSMMVSGFYQNI